MKQDPYTPVTLNVLNMCDDGDEVDYTDLLVRGFPVKKKRKFEQIKIKGNDEDEFDVKNLTVYAHAFEPPAREKIEANGGRCVRLTAVGSVPIGQGWLNTNDLQDGGDDEEGEESAAEE
eukprot:gb/GFBE01069105.1/.p1 GENE.gb/GFBE01069105.1/~~gb/GFBE01069105.1/.p1  ORF type:complete len:119 (+),score=42.22 gb/GFBE01069105.1/:1-357(+)